jgi:hypothetical protein
MIDADADVEWLLRTYASPSARRHRRLDQRDEAIRQLAAEYDLAGGRALVRAIHRDLIFFSSKAIRVAIDRPRILHRVGLARPSDGGALDKLPHQGLQGFECRQVHHHGDVATQFPSLHVEIDMDEQDNIPQ